jgi:hypothetical protein
MTGRLAHSLIVISLSVFYFGVFTSWLSVSIYRLISKQLSDSGLHMLGSAHIRIGELVLITNLMHNFFIL